MINSRAQISCLLFLVLALAAPAQNKSAEAAGPANRTAVATTAMTAVPPAQDKSTEAAGPANRPIPGAPARAPGFLEHMVDTVLERFDVRTSENTAAHYGIAGMFLVGALLLRRVVTNLLFRQLRKLTARTGTTLDVRLFPSLEAPVATFLMLAGIFCALRVLKFSEVNDRAISYGATVAFSLNLFWGLWCALDALLDHLHEVAREKRMSVAAFMPWIKKTLIAVFVVLGVLLTVQSLGYNVSTLIQGLGIGGLAFALAAQDTLANLFGSIVVAIDQPFKVGEAVSIGTSTGTVEEIGLRSTKIRLVDRSLVIIPNKTVSSEAIVNLSRFTSRRVEQVLGLTYATTPEQMEEIVREIRQLIEQEPGVDVTSVQVYFRDYSASSLDIWVAYVARDPDFAQHMALRQRLNLAFMRAVAARGLKFAFLSQTVYAGALPAAGKQG
jgi:MscS family membrane protein